MSKTISWVQVGDLHMDEADGMVSRERLAAIVAEVNARLGTAIDFVFLPGDNANHATPAQYAAIVEALAPLERRWRAIAGDHDFERGDLCAYEAAFPVEARPECEVIAGHRCLFLDIVSAGCGGPDFRVTMHDRLRVREELARAAALGQVPVVFMHGYPGDLAADGDELARAFAEGGVAFVATGHTHYNELLNDGRVVYGAVRSTAQIEEDAQQPGYAIVTVHDGVPSWRFRRIGADWPFVQIVAPADYRMVTRPHDPRHVPRPGRVRIAARVFGADGGTEVTVSVGGDAPVAMRAGAATAMWEADVMLRDGINVVTVAAGADRDAINVLAREAEHIPKRRATVAPGCDCHAIGAWPEHGIEGTQLGPNKNGAPQ